MANDNNNVLTPKQWLSENLLVTLREFWNSITAVFATKQQVTANLQTKANINHNHDTRYYTEAESDMQFAYKTELQSEQNRAMTKEAQLQGQIIRPINMDALTPSSTFLGNDCVAINGVFYRALRNTGDFPVTMVIQNGQFVYNQSASGHKAYVVADGTLHSDWEVWSDSSIDFWREYFDTRLDSKLDLDTQVGDYSVQQLLEYVASQMANQ